MPRKYYIEKSPENHDTLLRKAEGSDRFKWADNYKQLMYIACPYSRELKDGFSLKLFELDRDNRFIVLCNEKFIASVYRLYDWGLKDGDPLDYIDVAFSSDVNFCSMNMKVDEAIYKEPTVKKKPKAKSAVRTKLDVSGVKTTKKNTKPKARSKTKEKPKPRLVYTTQLDMFG